METQREVPFQIHGATELRNPYESTVRDRAGMEKGLTVARSQAEHSPTPQDQAPGQQQGFLTLLQSAKAPGWSLGCISAALPPWSTANLCADPWGTSNFPPGKLFFPPAVGGAPADLLVFILGGS